MQQKVFISYVFEDHFYRDQVADWARAGLLGDVEIVFEKDDVRAKGAAAIRSHLRPIMRDAQAILVLVGEDTHSRRWVDEEVHYCASSGKAVAWARLPNTTGAPPVELRGHSALTYQPGAIKEGLATLLRGHRK